MTLQPLSPTSRGPKAAVRGRPTSILMAASDGSDVVVVWDDTRASAPGIYARRLRCTVSG